MIAWGNGLRNYVSASWATFEAAAAGSPFWLGLEPEPIGTRLETERRCPRRGCPAVSILSKSVTHTRH